MTHSKYDLRTLLSKIVKLESKLRTINDQLNLITTDTTTSKHTIYGYGKCGVTINTTQTSSPSNVAIIAQEIKATIANL